MNKNPAPARPSTFEQAVALYQQGKFQEALAVARREVATLANVAGAAARQLGLTTEAERHWRAAIAAWPDFAEAHYNLGVLLKESNHLDDAEAAYRRALAIQPYYAEALHNLGNLLKARGRFAEAEAVYRQLLAIRPNQASTYNNLAILLKRRGLPEAAEQALRQALAIDPQYADAHCNLGTVLHQYGRLEEAEAAYRLALRFSPEHADARLNLGIILLTTGRLAEGWPLYDARASAGQGEPGLKSPPLPCPRWQGEALAGKALLLLPEQGNGDQIQFCRYVSRLKAQGAARVDLVCDRGLATLLETLDGIDSVMPIADTIALNHCDYWTFLLSIPAHLNTSLSTIPADLPYLRALPERVRHWAPRLPPGGLRVGLAWRGSERLENDANRSLPGLRTLAPLWSVPGITFISLQKGAGEDEAAAPPAGQPLVHLGSAIEDFADTAAIVSQLDLVICVDTAIAHLTGALGKPCWVLLPRIGTDWRWLLERDDSPWYPGVMRLFRQTTPGDWAEIVGKMADSLRYYTAAS